MLTAIYNADFNEHKTGRLGHSLVNTGEISFEDWKFLKMMDEKCFIRCWFHKKTEAC